MRIIDPLGYVDFLGLVRGASLVVTDSGGVQEETTILDVPCLTRAAEHGTAVTITHGTNRLVRLEDVVAASTAVLGAVRCSRPIGPRCGMARPVGAPPTRSSRSSAGPRHESVASRVGRTHA